MHILITGGAGFVGVTLAKVLKNSGHAVTVVDAAPEPEKNAGGITYIQADTTGPGAWQDAVSGADAIVNLTGKNIFHLWTKKYKQMIYDTRILTTRHIASALDRGRPLTLISTSAAGYYGTRGDDVLDESAGPGDDFLARVCMDWETEALAARKKGARVVCARFGVVLGKNDGALAKMVPAYRLFAGGPLGDGSHWFPWIQMDDLTAAIVFLLKNDAMEGPVNCCSPNPVRNREFAKTLGRALNRPAFFRTPAFLLRLAAGELGNLLLNSQRAVPSALLNAGFKFQYPNIEDALRASVT